MTSMQPSDSEPARRKRQPALNPFQLPGSQRTSLNHNEPDAIAAELRERMPIIVEIPDLSLRLGKGGPCKQASERQIRRFRQSRGFDACCLLWPFLTNSNCTGRDPAR
jgi:hypothetical protein